MEYRRFGKTNKNISVVTLGGMRYKQGWGEPRNEVPRETLEQAMAVTQKALDSGINHIETAWGYGKSEHIYGQVFKELGLKRDQFYLMTKGNKGKDCRSMRERIELQLAHLQTDYIDFYGWHGINNAECWEDAKSDIKELETLKSEGLIHHIGLSTHAPASLLMDIVQSDLFEFINLHYYYFFQRHWPAVAEAAKRDMGVFIISPNDKGGQLWKAPDSIRRETAPYTPLQFNARWCLKHPEVHTLSFGLSDVAEFEENLGFLDNPHYLSEVDLKARERMDKRAEKLGSDRCTVCQECLETCPENINIPEVLRIRNMGVAYDMHHYGDYRYNMFQEKGHWFPGTFADQCTECGDCLPHCPEKLEIPRLLFDTHKRYYKEKPAN